MTTARGGQRVPRSGGRTAERAERRSMMRGARTARSEPPVPAEFATEGSSALKPDVAGPRRASLVAAGGAARAGEAAGGGALRARLRVAPPMPVVAPRMPFVLLVLSVVIGGVLGVLVLNTKINENAFRLYDLEQRQTTLNVQEEQLQQELAEQESPGNLAAAARRLGLVPAGTPAFIRMPDGRVLGVPQPATSQPSITSQQAPAGGG
ncbi:MAG TPA: hypothetical protein VFM54_19695 [Micromonosporaceae bacterium]|nr:hypothetical protein [Micromonosporaceae bacterium]